MVVKQKVQVVLAIKLHLNFPLAPCWRATQARYSEGANVKSMRLITL